MKLGIPVMLNNIKEGGLKVLAGMCCLYPNRSCAMKRLIIIFVSLIVLSGCISTPYQKLADLGGYTDRQLDNNTYRIEFKGNGYTRLETVDIYLLYRCAELTIEKGYDYFVIVTKDNIGSTSYSTTSTINPNGGVSTSNRSFTRYTATAIIKAYIGKKHDNEATAFDAREIMNNLQPEIVRPKDIGTPIPTGFTYK